MISAGGSYIAIKTLYKEQRFDSAASEFKTTVFSKLNGAYPVPCNLNGEEMHKLKESKSYVMGAATKFRPHVKDKQAFNNILDKYEILCSNLSGPCPVKLEEQDDRDIYRAELRDFAKTVDNLLAFTEEKSCVDSLCKKAIQICELAKKMVERFCLNTNKSS